jgi:hypothetical protein
MKESFSIGISNESIKSILINNIHIIINFKVFDLFIFYLTIISINLLKGTHILRSLMIIILFLNMECHSSKTHEKYCYILSVEDIFNLVNCSLL